jgi:hypothetical protein
MQEWGEGYISSTRKCRRLFVKQDVLSHDLVKGREPVIED